VSTGPRDRIFEATYACIARYGIGKTSVEDAARQARLSRATVYRYFPGGKDELIRETIAWEVARFFRRLADALAGIDDLPGLLEEALVFAHRAVEEHAVLQRVLATEPDRLLPELTVEANRVLSLIRAFLLPYLEREQLRAGVEPTAAAEHVARMFLSHLAAQGSWDLTDRAQVRDLVRTQFLAGIA
jgi:AcrR family transcriptional regulator